MEEQHKRVVCLLLPALNIITSCWQASKTCVDRGNARAGEKVFQSALLALTLMAWTDALKPDLQLRPSHTFNSLVGACLRAGDIEKAQSTIDAMRAVQLPLDVYAWTMQIDIWCRQGARLQA